MEEYNPHTAHQPPAYEDTSSLEKTVVQAVQAVQVVQAGYKYPYSTVITNLMDTRQYGTGPP